MEFKSFFITFFWVMLGVLMIFAAVFWSVSDSFSEFPLVKLSSFTILVLMSIVIFILLPFGLTIRAWKDRKLKPKTTYETYERLADNNLGYSLITNCVTGIYLVFSIGYQTSLTELLRMPVILIAASISTLFIYRYGYYQSKAKGYPAIYSSLVTFYPLGVLLLKILPKKRK